MGIPLNSFPAAIRERIGKGIATKPVRAKRFHGPKSAAKRKRLATMGGDTPEFLNSIEGKWLVRWRSYGGPEPVRQYAYIPGRRFRADFAFPAEKVLIEIDGGTWISGRHSRGTGQTKDAEKSNLAQREGWRVWRWTSDMIVDQRDFFESVRLLKELQAATSKGQPK